MSLEKAGRSQKNAASTSDTLSPGGDNPVAATATAFEIYHAAIANNRTPDNRLASYDEGKELSTDVECYQLKEGWKDRSTQQTTGLCPGTRLPPGLSSCPSVNPQKLGYDIDSGKFLEKQESQEAATIPNEVHKHSKPTSLPIMKHRSPAPSVSTTTTLSSTSPASSLASNGRSSAPAMNGMVQSDVAVIGGRCEACDRELGDSEHPHRRKGKLRLIEPASPYGTVPQSRRSGIPRQISPCQSGAQHVRSSVTHRISGR